MLDWLRQAADNVISALFGIIVFAFVVFSITVVIAEVYCHINPTIMCYGFMYKLGYTPW